MRSVHKVHIRTNKKQKETFDFWIRRCQYLYNVALEQRIETYKKTGKGIGYFEQKKELPFIKEMDASWKDVPNKSLTESLERLDKSFKNFFRDKKTGFPKFKNKDNYNSVYFVKEDVRIVDEKHIKLPKIKEKIKISEIIEPNYTSVTLKKESNKFYLIFNYDDKKELVYNKEKDLGLKCVGIDLGLKTLLTDTNNYQLKRFSTKLIKKYTNRIVELNQSLDRKKKGSTCFKKVKKQLNKTYGRLKDTRLDYVNKGIDIYVKDLKAKKIELVALGDIQVKEIILKREDEKKSKRSLRRSFGHNGLTQAKEKIVHRCEKDGIKVYKIDERYTSKACSCCGWIKDDLKLSDRVFNCDVCKNSIDRDLNGSINIRAVWQGQFNPYRLGSQTTEKKFVLKNVLNTF